MAKIGILGGTFNPIHIGHLIMAEQAYEQFQLDKVLFMPSKNPPHKNTNGILPDSIRKDMVLRAIEGNQRFEFSDLEMVREGITYTVDTLRILKERVPESDLFFILGADSLYQFTTWRDPKTILELATILSTSRYGISIEELEMQKRYLEELYGNQFAIINMPQIDLSSKNIRERIKRGKTIRYFVPESVYAYIMENGLYV